MFRHFSLFLILKLLIASEASLAGDLTSSSKPAESQEFDFQQDIRPILSSNCFQCHGPDENTREADLRIDKAKAAYADLGGYFAILPGDSEESEVIRRIYSDDEYEMMPPPDSGKELTDQQKQLLKNWIDSGAEYEEHWAFVTPQKKPAIDLKQSDWPINKIDEYVLEKLENEGLEPAPEADPYQLVRRVYLDLIGIPPTVTEADAFVMDDREDAYERLVDRLLASPHYGERWARRWLDLARYSDTKGYEKDRPRTMWLYRDWVINAFNNDMPFDQFTVEQIAGDMLPNPTVDQLIATGFHRNTMTNEEGGIDPQEFRFHAVVDRVATTGTTWLGLTVGCAQCHTHKFDPITHNEYYQLFAFLNNSDEIKIHVPQDDIREECEKVQSQIEVLKAKLADQYPQLEESDSESGDDGVVESSLSLEADFLQWKKDLRSKLVDWNSLQPVRIESNLPIPTLLEDNSVLCSGDVTKNDTFELYFDVVGQSISAIRLEALPHPQLPGGGPGRQTIVEGGGREGSFFLSEVKAAVVNASPSGDEENQLSWKSASASFVAPELSADLAIDGKHDTGWINQGREGERHTLVMQLSEPVTLSPGQLLKIQLEHESYYPAGLGRFRISSTSDARDIQALGLSKEHVEALNTEEDSLTQQQQKELLDHFLMTTPKLKAQQEAIMALLRSMPEHPTALVMKPRHTEHLRSTNRHHRGEYLQPKELVKPGGIDALHDLEKGESMNRLSFARWLISQENPLVARVVINRHWEAFFGAGLVKTTEDFGYQGEFPTHPKLLDWLAVEFMDRNWSLKHIHKLIVTSATYKQSPTASIQSTERDPENKLLSRSPRFRVESELVRDIILQSSGLLSPKIGGPSVFPPQPKGITEAAYGALIWNVSQGEDRYRRGLYTFNKRTAPYAAFGLFDAPSGEVCIARRNRSNTPLQSLAMLNDDVVTEAARHMAGETLKNHNEELHEEIATELFRRCLTRQPSDEELAHLVKFYRNQYERMLSTEALCNRVLNSGSTKVWDFSDDITEWKARKQCTIKTEDGVLLVASEGEDPYIGTALESPEGPYTLSLRAKFTTDGVGEVYWTNTNHESESPDRNVNFEIIRNQWHDYQVTFDTAEPLTSLRIDPGQSKGTISIEWIKLTNGDGLYVVPDAVNKDSLAAWMLTARVLLNLDETITKQ